MWHQMVKRKIWKDLEENGHGLVEVLSGPLAGETEQNNENTVRRAGIPAKI